MDERLLNLLSSFFSFTPSVEKAVLFGSRARGDNNERSDYDIAIYGNVPFEEMARLRYFCDEGLPTLLKFDLVFVGRTKNKELLKNIENEGKVFYEKAR